MKRIHGRSPIGIFDSGLGGLTVVRQLRRLLPAEDLIYLGDTARVPYGNKTPATIQRFSYEDTRFLLSKRVKMVVVACNTSTALALEYLQRTFSCPFVGVIQPGATAAVHQTRRERIGVIATKATVSSGAYEREVRRLAPEAEVFSQACPLLVPLVEEGWTNHRVTREIARHYLRPLLAKRIDTLILGCTHYPLLKGDLQKVAGRSVKLVDSALNCALAVREFLENADALRGGRRKGKLELFVTDRPRSFSKLARIFLGPDVPAAVKVEQLS